MLRTVLTPLLLAASALLLSSCFEQSETTTINADGSGTIVQELIFNKDMWQDMKPQAEAGLEEGEEEMKELAQKMGEGVEFKSAEIVDKVGGKGGMVVTYTFTDINKVQLFGLEEGMSMDIGGGMDMDGMDEEADPEVSFSLDGDKLKVNLLALQEEVDDIVAEADADEAAEDGEMDMDMEMGEMKGMMKMMLGEAKMSRTIVFSSGIDESTASHVDGNEVTLFEVPFSALFEEENWEELMEMEGENPAEEAAALNAVEGVEVETQKSFLVDMGE